MNLGGGTIGPGDFGQEAGALPGLAGASGLGLTGLGTMGLGAIVGGIGAYGQSQAAQGISQSSQNIAQLQMQQNKVQWNQAQLTSRRNSMQELRNAQQARSYAQSSATNQGAQFGSGLQGGYGQIAGQAGTNLLGINQNLKLGEQAYNINQGISTQEMNIAKYQGQASMWAGLGSIGGGLSGLGGSLTNSATNPGGSLFGGPNAGV